MFFSSLKRFPSSLRRYVIFANLGISSFDKMRCTLSLLQKGRGFITGLSRRGCTVSETGIFIADIAFFDGDSGAWSHDIGDIKDANNVARNVLWKEKIGAYCSEESCICVFLSTKRSCFLREKRMTSRIFYLKK
jgi:hypothetical protein